jgi:hypothetical protein
LNHAIVGSFGSSGRARLGDGSLALPENAHLELGSRDPVMGRHVAEDGGQGPDSQWATGGDGDTMLTCNRSSQP